MPELKLLIEQNRPLEQPPWWTGLAGTVAVHLLLALVIPRLPSSPRLRDAPLITANLRKAVPLVFPPAELTQRAPNRGKPSTEVNLEGLLSQPSLPSPPPTPSQMRAAAPKTIPGPAVPAAPAPLPRQMPPDAKPLPEPPKVEIAADTSALADRLPPGIGKPQAAATPQIEAVERPKIAFEKPGASFGSPSATGVAPGRVPLAPKQHNVEQTGRELARAGGGGGFAVGDVGLDLGGLGSALNRPGAPTRQGSSLELVSDPMGVDFKPYLIRILSTVRRNWTAVIPESARMGRRGKVLIQFAISKDGSVPKLVIATGSGTEALDRAAVAGISASNPFPPLPEEYRGNQVRLQFTFLYNIPAAQ
jgi:TonB family protein